MSSFEDKLPDLGILRRRWPEYEDPSTTHSFQVADALVGGSEQVIIAGPCAIESFKQTLDTARLVRQSGCRLMRGGVFKPRTNPHSFQGLGVEGLEILAEVRRETGLGIVTEVMDPRMVEVVVHYADMMQVGSRSMQNFPLLKEVGRTSTPVLLKRGWSSTLEEWLCAAEYIALEGNNKIALCERGIRSSCHWEYARNLLDLNVLGRARQVTPLPIIVDPSHATGQWGLVEVLGRAALAAGAHGLLVEVAPPEMERSDLQCDGDQGITGDILDNLMTFAASMASHPVVRQELIRP